MNNKRKRKKKKRKEWRIKKFTLLTSSQDDFQHPLAFMEKKYLKKSIANFF
jgi:hypothetical protein